MVALMRMALLAMARCHKDNIDDGVDDGDDDDNEDEDEENE